MLLFIVRLRDGHGVDSVDLAAHDYSISVPSGRRGGTAQSGSDECLATLLHEAKERPLCRLEERGRETESEDGQKQRKSGRKREEKYETRANGYHYK